MFSTRFVSAQIDARGEQAQQHEIHRRDRQPDQCADQRSPIITPAP